MSLWRAGCGESRTSGSEGGPGKPTSRKAGRAPRSDPYTYTYIRTTAGWRYLAVWIDLYSRRVVGWAMGATMEATLVLEALNRALGHRQIETRSTPDPHRSREPVLGNSVPAAAGRPKDHLQHVGQGLLLGQRSGGELLLHPQTRTEPR
ncbi:MAG: DDE-type integrase/transposase/recombinase [Cyanobium sp.]